MRERQCHPVGGKLAKEIRQTRQKYRALRGKPMPEAAELFVAKVSQRYGLTLKEVAVLEQVLRGLTRDEIAEALNIPAETIKSRTRLLLRKTGHARTRDVVFEFLRAVG